MSDGAGARRGLALGAIVAVAVVSAWGARAILRAEGSADSPPAAAAAPANPPTPGAVTALGRLEPKNGVIRVAGPSRFAVVISQLLVDDGDQVKEGEPIAILDSHLQDKATVARMKAEVENNKREYARR